MRSVCFRLSLYATNTPRLCSRGFFVLAIQELKADALLARTVLCKLSHAYTSLSQWKGLELCTPKHTAAAPSPPPTSYDVNHL